MTLLISCDKITIIIKVSRGGLGLCSFTQYSPAAYIVSLCSSSFGSQSQGHLASAIHLFNPLVPLSEAINSEVLPLTPVTQKSLSSLEVGKSSSSLQSSSGHVLYCWQGSLAVCFLPSCSSIMAICHSFRGSRSPSRPFPIPGCH